MYYLEDINANTALKEKFYNGLFYSDSRHPWKRIRPLWYFLIFRLIKYFPGIRKKFLQSESRHLKSGFAKKLLEDLAPKTLVSTYPVSIMEAKLLYEAHAQNIHTTLHMLSWDNITTKGRFPVLPKYFVTWGPVMDEELTEYYGIDKVNKATCGVAHFDHHVKVREADSTADLSRLGLRNDRQYILIAMSSPRFAPKEIDIVEWLADQIQKDEFGKDMQLVVRPHPQNVTTFMANESWLARLEKIKSDRVGVDYPLLNSSKMRWSMKQEDMDQLAKLISSTILCLNSGSTISIDALMHHKPVIITAFDAQYKLPYWNSARRLIDYGHLKKFIREGGASVTTNYTELTHKIKELVKDPSKGQAKRLNALNRYCYKNDGQATTRIVNSLCEILQNNKSLIDG